MKNSFACLFVFLFLLFACKNTGKDPLPEIDVCEIDMNQGEEIVFDSLVKDITCIVLEEKPGSVLKYCTKILTYKNYIYLYSMSDKVVNIYRDNGDFIKQINGRSKGKINFPTTFLVDSLSEQLWILDNTRIVNQYDLTGEFIDKKEPVALFSEFIFINNSELLIYDGEFDKSSDYLIHLGDRDFSTYKKQFLQKNKDIKKHNFLPQSLFAKDTHTGDIYIQPRLNDTIYYFQAKEQTFVPWYHLNFHGDLLTEQIYPKEGFSDKEYHDLMQENRYIFSLYSFYWVADRLFFKMSGKRNDFACINTIDHTLTTFPVLFDNYRPAYPPFLGSDGQNLFCLVKAKELVAHYQQASCSYPSIKEILTSLNESENPWILLLVEIEKNAAL